ncbi:2-dehydropantoate 2-reductase [Halospeciosus flavus]|uniref:2-dehydropantoate 2-reductase n=1 Tax=Halospeciosus flavus TaxID=3032283 RepID=A0ABD5Z8Y1_9EURY|nr:2-dehydropantoate 2-reductase [Halospeciosus flavus]
MKFAIYGAGGVGAYLGARLADADHDVHLVARGEHLDALREEGLTVESVHGDTHVDVPATDDPADIGVCDFVLVCVKSYDTADVARKLDPLLDADTGVVSFQNGVDNERWLAEEVGEEHVLGGVAYIFSTIAEPGVVEHTGGPARFVFGEWSREGVPGRSARAERLHDALSACEGVESVLADDVREELWRKFVLICAQAGTSAAGRLTVEQIRSTEETWSFYADLMREVVAVAAAEGVDLPDDTVDEWLDFVGDLEADATSSLHYDLTHGKRMELEALNGSVVRHADEVGVDAPLNRAVYALLKPHADERGRERAD